MHSSQQYQQPRRAGTLSSQHDELHLSSGMAHQGQQPLSPRDYSSSSGAPHIKLDQSSSNTSGMANYPPHSGVIVPNVLQPGGISGRAPTIPSNSQPAPTLPSMQHQPPPDYQSHQSPSKSGSLNVSHSYSRSSPSANYDSSAGGSGYVPYTPTTPGGGGGTTTSSSQYMSPTEQKYNPPSSSSAGPSSRNLHNTPLGLHDIRPRADSSLSDGVPGTPGYELANLQPRTSNYVAPWALYAFDWCKWSPQANGAGKLAIGSYLEDGHNFVSEPCRPSPSFMC
jgi:WD repeat-containing protein 68